LKRTDTTLLANPKILAVNKQEGIVYIGRKIGYISQTSQNQTSTTQSVAFLETGTRLAFRPYIGDDGYIRMDIYPKDSDGTLKQNDIPDETSTELRTNVVVKDGQTVVIRSVPRQCRDSKSQVRCSTAGRALFRGKGHHQPGEVIVILTPHAFRIRRRPADKRGDIRMKRRASTAGGD
jgi:type II secretory pathway component HofQ